MDSVDQAMGIIKDMRGTLKVFPLDGKTRDDILKVERCIKSQIGMDVKNEGLEQCLARDHVLCILKNVQFRPPPEPTVLLLADEGVVIGREVLAHEKHLYVDREDLFWLSEDFVVFTERKPKNKEYFTMPPVAFPELEVIEGVSKVVSCSPSPLGDMVIKKRYDIEDDPRNATILVGFDSKDC